MNAEQRRRRLRELLSAVDELTAAYLYVHPTDRPSTISVLRLICWASAEANDVDHGETLESLAELVNQGDMEMTRGSDGRVLYKLTPNGMGKVEQQLAELGISPHSPRAGAQLLDELEREGRGGERG